MSITGRTLIDWGVKPGPHFKRAIELANEMGGADQATILAEIAKLIPVTIPLREKPIPYAVALDTETDAERANAAGVFAHMDELMRVPTIKGGAVMPDACPSGSALGTIPVGGVVACQDAIHPGFHSADICCSVAITVLAEQVDPKRLLDALQLVTHFGPGGRQLPPPLPGTIARRISDNELLADLMSKAVGDFGSQGDGNHFAYVGHLRSTGETAIVTHHGSRGFGAALYKKGMQIAQRYTAKVAPEVPKHNAWIKADSAEGWAYWQALDIARQWTRENHYVIHQQALAAVGASTHWRFWNEHNFVFQKPDGLFYHGKGATPSFDGFSTDDTGYTLIPLNMSEPVLITRHRNNVDTLGFAPHGAGRNASRTAHMRANAGTLDDELAALAARGLDIRSFCGVPDLSELPSAYKNAAAVREQIQKFDLAHVEDEVVPYGSIMAGDWERDAPWRKKVKGS